MRSALALVAFLAVGLVSGCGGGGEPAPDEGRPAPGESEASAPSSRDPVPAGDPVAALCADAVLWGALAGDPRLVAAVRHATGRVANFMKEHRR